MREIKFRGKMGSNSEWTYGDLVHDAFNGNKIFPIGIQAPGCYPEEVIRDTIGQFTGLLDKNGKEVYEGDIVFSKDWNPEKQVVTFDRGGFCLKYDGGGYYPDIKYAEQMTVIGNIHEQQP